MYIGQRENIGVVEQDLFQVGISIPAHFWKGLQPALNRAKDKFPGVEVKISEGWLYHNAGWRYKEAVAFSHLPGRAEEFIRYIDNEMQWLVKIPECM